MGEGEALPKLLTPNSSLLIKKVCHVSADQDKHAARSYPIDVTFLMIKKSNFVAVCTIKNDKVHFIVQRKAQCLCGFVRYNDKNDNIAVKGE